MYIVWFFSVMVDSHFFKKNRSGQGVIIWDLDHVLFDTERFALNNRKSFFRWGIPVSVVKMVREELRRKKKHFTPRAISNFLRHRGYNISERETRTIIHGNLSSYNYLFQNVDRVLDELKRKNFRHFIVSFGHPLFQRRKIHTGCGENFGRHFESIFVTSRGSKYRVIRRIVKKFPGNPVFFIDDTKEHIDLVRRHVPNVHAIHYTPAHSLQKVRKEILQFYGRNSKNKRK